MAVKLNTWIIFCVFVICFQAKLTFSHGEALAPMWNKYELSNNLSNFRTAHLDPGRNKLYVGGVNTLYQFDSNNVTHAPAMLNWHPQQENQQTCLNFKSDEMLCQNNVGVLEAVNDTHLYTCGTMAYSPVCRYMNQESFSFEERIDRGRWKTPSNPYVSIVSVIANETLFTATQSSMQGNKGIISRTLNGVTLRTLESDKYWLNDPVFVGGHHVRYLNPLHDKVMIFFREKAEEFRPFDYGLASSPDTRNVVSRIATVCVNDHGGSAWVLNRKFATYQKMTVVCNTGPDGEESTFRYTQLESTFMLKNDVEPNNPTIYGIFTMPNDAIGGSAVCAYKMREVLSALSQNSYWNRRSSGNGVKTEYDENRSDMPGSCAPETRELSQSRLTFAREHPVKFGVLYRSPRTPFYHEAPTRYTHIVVHKISANKNALNQNVTVLFMITSEGRMKRVVIPDSNPRTSWSLPDIQAVKLRPDECVIKLEIGERDVFVITNRSITQIPMAACSLYEDCQACQNARDPYCILNVQQTCASVIPLNPTELSVLRETRSICINHITEHVTESSIVDLQSNLTDLMQRNRKAMRLVAMLTMDRNRKAEAHGACSDSLEEWMQRVVELDERLLAANRKLDRNRENLTNSLNNMKKCNHSRNMMTSIIFSLNQQIIRQREDFNAVELRSQQTRNLALIAVRDCEIKLNNASRAATSCDADLQRTTTSLQEINQTCTVQQQFEIDSLRAQINALNRKFSFMKMALGQIDVRRNYTVYEASKKISMCRQRNMRLQAGNILLRKKTKNISLRLGVFTRLVKRQGTLIKQLKWLHRQNGLRGQQKCQYNGWFQVNTSGSLFLLGKKRVSFENAEGFCEALGGRLAIFKNQQELRYINNVIRAHEPKRNFWIGLIKHADRTLTWHNGNPLGRFRSRFPESQRIRLMRREKYCVEINSFQRWILIPCFRIRRPICQKDPEGFSTRGYTLTTASYRRSAN